MAACDTFRAAASDQLEIWAERTGCERKLKQQQEILLVLDGNTGLNMLPQAREFNEVSVIEELGIPVKFISVREAVEDLQPFDAEAFVNAIFS